MDIYSVLFYLNSKHFPVISLFFSVHTGSAAISSHCGHHSTVFWEMWNSCWTSETWLNFVRSNLSSSFFFLCADIGFLNRSVHQSVNMCIVDKRERDGGRECEGRGRCSFRVCLCLYVCVRACVFVCMYTCLCLCVHTCMCAHMHAYVHACKFCM